MGIDCYSLRHGHAINNREKNKRICGTQENSRGHEILSKKVVYSWLNLKLLHNLLSSPRWVCYRLANE